MPGFSEIEVTFEDVKNYVTAVIAIFIIVFCPHRLTAQNARVQWVHCSADSALKNIDIWLDTNLVSENLVFRSATPLSVVSAGTVVVRVVKHGLDTTQAVFTDTIVLSSNEQYAVFLAGHVSSGYTPAHPFGIHLIKEPYPDPGIAGHTALRFFNGISDGGDMRCKEFELTGQYLTDKLAFGESSPVINLESLNYLLAFESDHSPAGLYRLTLTTSGLADSSIILVASGYKNPSTNNNGAGLSWAYLKPSGGAFTTMPVVTGKVRFVNDIVSGAFTSVDVYANQSRVYSDLKYRHATNEINLPAYKITKVDWVATDGDSLGKTIVSDTIVPSYKLGDLILGSGDAQHGQNGNESPVLTYHTYNFTSGLGSNSDLSFIHSSPDAVSLTVFESKRLNSTLFPAVGFGHSSAIVQLPVATYTLELQVMVGLTFKSYDLNLSEGGYSGKHITLIASGLSDTALADSQSVLGLYKLPAAAGALTELNQRLGISQPNDSKVKVFPNPSSGRIFIQHVANGAAYHVFTMSGDLLHTGTVNENGFDTGQLSDGTYVLQIETENGPVIKRIEIIR
ncbi:MAG: hypothetical protein Kow0075_03790 [Salibacteraceae bacterium]